MDSILPQLVLNGLIAGSLYALIALGLALTYGILKFVNFAHGNLVMTGAYLFFLAHERWEWSFGLSFLFALLTLAGIGLLIERVAFKPVRNSPILIPLLLSIGISILLESMILMFFGSGVKSLSDGIQTHLLWGGRIAITNVQIIIFIASLALMAFTALFLKKTKTGKAIRAVAENREAAAILGIPLSRIIGLVFILSSMLAAIAGILVGYDQNLYPSMGLTLSIIAFSAVMLGGLGSIKGAVLGAFLIGLAENILIGISIGGFSIPSGYKGAISFLALILMLYLKPNGLLGQTTEEGLRK